MQIIDAKYVITEIEKLGLNLAKIAKESGLHPSTLSYLKSGKRKFGSLETLQKLKKVYDEHEK
jgi:transcriptional regulator with XRE-family HTH domain